MAIILIGRNGVRLAHSEIYKQVLKPSTRAKSHRLILSSYHVSQPAHTIMNRIVLNQNKLTRCRFPLHHRCDLACCRYKRGYHILHLYHNRCLIIRLKYSENVDNISSAHFFLYSYYGLCQTQATYRHSIINHQSLSLSSSSLSSIIAKYFPFVSFHCSQCQSLSLSLSLPLSPLRCESFLAVVDIASTYYCKHKIKNDHKIHDVNLNKIKIS
jgi:hypothetical protein